MRSRRARLASIALAALPACAPVELSAAGANVAVIREPGAGCARVAELRASAGYNGRGAEANTAGVEASLRNDAAIRGANVIVIRERTLGAAPVDPLAQPGGTQRGGCPNCVAMRADAYRCGARAPAATAPRDTFTIAADAALDAALERARACLSPEAPRGEARLRVTFAPTGDVVYAEVEGGPLEGTSAAACVAAKARNAHVPAFEGAARSVTRALNLAP